MLIARVKTSELDRDLEGPVAVRGLVRLPRVRFAQGFLKSPFIAGSLFDLERRAGSLAPAGV